MHNRTNLNIAEMHSGNRDHESKDQIIEIDDYKIVDETENRVAEDHKVVIC